MDVDTFQEIKFLHMIGPGGMRFITATVLFFNIQQLENTVEILEDGQKRAYFPTLKEEGHEQKFYKCNIHRYPISVSR